MSIGFCNGIFYRIKNSLGRFSRETIKRCKIGNAIELHLADEGMVDYLLEHQNTDLSGFSFISIHAPCIEYKNNNQSKEILEKLNQICLDRKIVNVVFHTDLIIDWDIFNKYRDIPISIENVDERGKNGRFVKDIKPILDKYNFGLTLDLQHCFCNDRTMGLAKEFQEIFKDKIVEYHISGFDEKLLHYPLFKTRQDEIIKSLKYKDIPIIIESTFDDINEQLEELEYIKDRITKGDSNN
ncbi:MAG: hypothetical protein V1770_04510 [bacterium]